MWDRGLISISIGWMHDEALAKPEDAEQRMCTDGAMMSIFAGESERPALTR